MNLSRKEFLTRGLFAFGRELAEAARGDASRSSCAAQGEMQGLLVIDNPRCLAQRGGCFACLDRCPREAISIRLGVGIAVDADTCDGCGECIDCCPVEPKVISLSAGRRD